MCTGRIDLSFVLRALQTGADGVFVGGCWLGFTVSSGYSSPGFLLSIPAMLLAFAMLHAVSTLVGVVTRSTGVAALFAIGVWFMSSMVATGRTVLAAP